MKKTSNKTVTPKMLKSYLETALWSSTNPDTEEPMEKYHTTKNFSTSFREIAKQDLQKFVNLAKEKLNAWKDSDIGHYFWLSRNGHGAGFFDESRPEYF